MDTRTDRRTFRFIESIGPEGQCFENYMAMVIPSASVEIFSVSHLRDFLKQSSVYAGITQIGRTPPSILSNCGALLQVNQDIFTNAAKQFSNVWHLKMY